MIRFVFAFSFVFLGVFSATAACLDPARVRGELMKDFAFEGGGDVASGDLCDTSRLSNVTLAALLFLKDLGTLPENRDGFSAGVLNGKAYDYFKLRAKKIVLETNASDEDCAGLMHVLPTDPREEGIVHVCPKATKYNMVVLATGLVHEARHLDGAEFSHQVCQAGIFAGGFSCDPSFEHSGSYAVGVEFDALLWRAKSLNPALREQARATAVVDILSHFNQLPLDLRAGALLAGESGELTFFDGVKLSGVPFKLPTDGVLTQKSGLATIFERGSGQVKQYGFGPGLVPAPPDILTRRFAELGERAEVRDVIYGNRYVCFLLESTLQCAGPDYKFFRKDLPAGVRGVRFLKTDMRSSFIAQKIVHLLAEDGVLYALPESVDDLRSLEAARWNHSSGVFPLADVHPFGFGTEIGLFRDGKVSVYERRSKKWTTPPALEGKKVRSMLAPFVWSDQLRDL